MGGTANRDKRVTDLADCPKCGAKKGQPCKGLIHPHGQRREAWKRARPGAELIHGPGEFEAHINTGTPEVPKWEKIASVRDGVVCGGLDTNTMLAVGRSGNNSCLLIHDGIIVGSLKKTGAKFTLEMVHPCRVEIPSSLQQICVELVAIDWVK